MKSPTWHEELGRLPLALAQAAAYIADRGLTVPAYRRRFADRRNAWLNCCQSTRPPTVTRSPRPEKSRATVAATWSLSIDAANALDRSAWPARLLGTAVGARPQRHPTHAAAEQQRRRVFEPITRSNQY